MSRGSLFRLGKFKLASGIEVPYKIDCDALTWRDWKALAFMLQEVLPPFSAVEGVPRGGTMLAKCMQELVTPYSRQLLIVDDVFTTGGSMERVRADRDAIGAVIFARNECPFWITPLFLKTPERTA